MTWLYLLAVLALAITGWVVWAYRQGEKGERLKSAEATIDAVEVAKNAEAGVDVLTADARRNKLREWTR